MLKKSIKYEDLDGNEIVEDFYFNMNKTEVMEWMTTDGGYTLDKVMERVAEQRNARQTMEIIKDIIFRSYGKPSLDRKRFEKSDESTKAFMETDAYSTLFMEIATDGRKAIEFISGIIPKSMIDDITKVIEENPDAIPEEYRDYIPKNGGPTNFPVVK